MHLNDIVTNVFLAFSQTQTQTSLFNKNIYKYLSI